MEAEDVTAKQLTLLYRDHSTGTLNILDKKLVLLYIKQMLVLENLNADTDKQTNRITGASQ